MRASTLGRIGSSRIAIPDARAGELGRSSPAVRDRYKIYSALDKSTVYDGTGDFFLGGRLSTGSMTAFSCAWWVKQDAAATDVLGGESSGIAAMRCWDAFLLADGKLYVDLYPTSTFQRWVTTGAVITPAAATFTHLVIVYSQPTITFYTDGSVEPASGPNVSSIQDVAASFTIGTQAPGVNDFDGTLSGVVFEQRAWSAGEVTALYNRTGVPSGAFYFKDGNGTDIQRGGYLGINGTPTTSSDTIP